jgi:hypothetical protein
MKRKENIMARQMASGPAATANWLTLILAVWLFISPWVLQSASMGNFAWDAWIVGVLVALLSLGALYQVTEWEDWGNLILGLWLFISPWVLGFSGTIAAAWDGWIVGILVAAISIWGITAIRGYHGAAHA